MISKDCSCSEAGFGDRSIAIDDIDHECGDRDWRMQFDCNSRSVVGEEVRNM